jgi:hypothetical protein
VPFAVFATVIANMTTFMAVGNEKVVGYAIFSSDTAERTHHGVRENGAGMGGTGR